MRAREQTGQPMRKLGYEGSCMAVCRPASCYSFMDDSRRINIAALHGSTVARKGQHTTFTIKAGSAFSRQSAREYFLAVCAWSLARFHQVSRGCGCPHQCSLGDCRLWFKPPQSVLGRDSGERIPLWTLSSLTPVSFLQKDVRTKLVIK